MAKEVHGGAYNFRPEDTAQKKSLRSTWEAIYQRKDGQAVSSKDKTDGFVPSDKHLAYLSAFAHLGFFDDLPNKPKILQAGLGHGKTLRAMVERVAGSEPIGLDISYTALTHATENGIKHLIQGDILSLPLADKSLDRIFEVGVVEHLYADDPFDKEVVDRKGIVDSFKELHRTLKDGGKVGFIQPSQHSTLPLSKKINQLSGRWDMGFQEDFSLTEFCQLLNIAGFDNIKYCVLQAPQDFPRLIRAGDRALKTFYTLTGKYRKAELTGAMFAVVGEK